MAYDEKLAERIRKVLKDKPGIDEKKMFGGIAFLDRGNMCVGIVRSDLMVRVGRDAYEKALARPHTREMDFTGKSLAGYVYVAAEGIKTEKSLAAWVERGLAFAQKLPAKAK